MPHPFEEEAQPLTLSPASGVTDSRGNLVISPEDDPQEAIEDETNSEAGIGFAAASEAYLTAGLYNADFAIGPPDATDTIDDQNALPYWRLTGATASAVHVTWGTSAAGPSGRAVTFAIDYLAASEWVYFEQVVPVDPRRAVYIPELTVGTATTSTTAVAASLRAAFLDATGTALAAATRADLDWTNAAQSFAIAPIYPPSTARFLRVRFGVTSTAAYSTATTQAFYQAWNGAAMPSYATLTCADLTFGAAGTATSTFSGLGVFRAPAYGWVSSLSIGGGTAPTGNTYVLSVYNATQSKVCTPTVTMTGGQSYGYATVLPGTASDFAPGDQLYPRCVATGTATPAPEVGISFLAVMGMFTNKARTGSG